MKKIFLLMGNFGVGKTSITNFRKHHEIEENDPFTEVSGLLSLGGERGADELSHRGWDKRKVYEELLPKYEDRDILIHSVFYQGIQDINRYEKTHKVVVIYLRTPYEVNKERIEKRSGGKKKINNDAFIQNLKSVEKIRQFCAFAKAKYHRVDNDRPLKTVAEEVWKIIDQERWVPPIGDSEIAAKPDDAVAI